MAQKTLRAKAFYCGDEVPTKKRPTRMAAGTGAAPGQAPPDLPSLLLDGRICYIGMPVRSLVGRTTASHLAGVRLPVLTVQLTPVLTSTALPLLCH